MIDLKYLEKKLFPLGYQMDNSDLTESPVFWKHIAHKNDRDLYAFTIVIITLDVFTISIEGFNELLINRALAAGAIKIEKIEELDALRYILYDNTLEEVKRFELLLSFMEKQFEILVETVRTDEAHQKAVHHLRLMVEAANAVDEEDGGETTVDGQGGYSDEEDYGL